MRVKLSAEKVLAGRMIYSILGHAIRGMYVCMLHVHIYFIGKRTELMRKGFNNIKSRS